MGNADNERAIRGRRRQRRAGQREIRMNPPDALSARVRERVAASVASLDPQDEENALRWIEAVSELDVDSTR